MMLHCEENRFSSGLRAGNSTINLFDFALYPQQTTSQLSAPKTIEDFAVSRAS